MPITGYPHALDAEWGEDSIRAPHGIRPDERRNSDEGKPFWYVAELPSCKGEEEREYGERETEEMGRRSDLMVAGGRSGV